MRSLGQKQLSAVAKKLFGDSKHVPHIVHEGRKALHAGEGTHSFFLWPLMAAIKRLKGKQVIDSTLYQKYHRRLIAADDKMGRILAQHGPSEKLFSSREIVPTTKKIRGLPAHVAHEGFSASAPIKKMMGVATPLMAGTYASEKLNPETHKKTGALMASDKAKALMKEAADTIERHRRREEAIKIAMEMVERGKCEPFKTHEDLMSKVASLEEKNLDAVREALDMDSDLSDFGKIASPTSPEVRGANKAEADFFHRLSE